jgi:hypothetical protein
MAKSACAINVDTVSSRWSADGRASEGRRERYQRDVVTEEEGALLAGLGLEDVEEDFDLLGELLLELVVLRSVL